MSRNRDARSLDLAGIFGACEKTRYPHQRAAEEARERQLQLAADRGEALHLRVYACPNSWCGGWHLTSSRR